MLGLTQQAVFHGPNPYAKSAVIVVNVQIQEEVERQVEKLCGALRAQYPRWFQIFEPDAASPVVLLSQTAAHWALSALNEVRGFLHDAGAKPAGDGADIWLEFHDERSVATHCNWLSKRCCRERDLNFHRKPYGAKLELSCKHVRSGTPITRLKY